MSAHMLQTPVPQFMFLALFILIKSSSTTDYKANKTPNFSTKTPYFWLEDINEDITEDSETFFDHENKVCQIIHLNTILRHGTRYPSLKWIKRMTELHKKLLSKGVDQKYPFLKGWTNPFLEDSDKLIAKLGQEEHKKLGERFAKRFNLLFEEDIDGIRFIVSSKQRTQASSLSFYEGLTKKILGEVDRNYKHKVDDIALRFHDNCKHFKDSIDSNKTATSEYTKFKYGPEVGEVGKLLNEALGIENEGGINPDDINTIHQYCAFEEALTEGESEWCQFLDEENLQVIQYMNDLKQYWKKMYGHDLTSDMSCPLLGGIFDTLDKVIRLIEEDEDYESAIFQFGHAETLAPLYAGLGLFKDDPPLRADNFKQHLNRQFVSSKVLPFSANFAVALYECDSAEEGEEVKREDISYMLKFFVNEKEIDIPACGKKVCSYADVRGYYRKHIDQCQFHKLCKNPEQGHDEL